MKRCTNCKAEKSVDSFNIQSLHCKLCVNTKRKIYGRTKKGIVTNIYKGQKSTSIKRGHVPPNYTLKELRPWLLAQPKFHVLHEKWVASNYDIWKKPSLDRLNDDLPYGLDNMTITTWRINFRKQTLRTTKLIKKNAGYKPKEIIQLTMDGCYVAKYPSYVEAIACNKVFQSHLSIACRLGNKNVGGYYWMYA